MASSASASKRLGKGQYSIAEAALLARVSPTMMRRWVIGDGGGADDGRRDKLVSFFSLIETQAIREIRFQRALPLSAFRAAVAVARREYGVDHPFAHSHRTTWKGGELRIQVLDALAVRRAEQDGSEAFVELYQRDLTFDRVGAAVEWRTFTSKEGVVVKLRPELRFGEPLLPSGYTPFAVWDSIRTEGGVERAAAALGVDSVEALAAYEYIVDHLNARPTSKRAA